MKKRTVDAAATLMPLVAVAVIGWLMIIYG